jgi:hypothetical protein
MALPYRYEGEGVFRATRRTFAMRADDQYVIGEVYQMAPVEERSAVSHRHEFAWLREAWMQLPDNLAPVYPTPEHLRKRALIEVGWYNEQAIDAESNAAALRVAAFIRGREEFSVVIVERSTVLVRTAKSQSVRAMGRKDFQDSKTAIMEIVSDLIGVSPDALQRNAGAAA